MTIQHKTALATILRQLAQGFLTHSDAYHAIADLYMVKQS